jgi:hypothetical protein
VRPDSFLLGEGLCVQLDDDVWYIDKCIPMLEEEEEGKFQTFHSS